MDSLRDKTAICGVGNSDFVPLTSAVSPLVPLVRAFKNALDDAGMDKSEIDGLLVNIGTPTGVDYDQVADGFGLSINIADQTWTHGRQMASVLGHAAMIVNAGLASVVACVCSINWKKRNNGTVGGHGTNQDDREIGGSHFEHPFYGMTSPGGAFAMAVRRYFSLYGASSADLAQVAIAIRRHALMNPNAIMKKPLTLEDHQNSRFVCEPLRLFDYCQTVGGACVVLVTSAERARSAAKKPVYISGVQGMAAGREEATGGRPGLGLHQQSDSAPASSPRDVTIYEMSGVDRSDVDALYTYDAMTSNVWMTLERFGFCKAGEAWQFVNTGAIAPGGSLPVNTNGGLLSEAHVSGWNHVCEMVRQLRGECGERQVPGAEILQWASNRGDSFILRR